MSARTDSLAANEGLVLAVSGPSQHHLALIENALKVLIETPGGGFVISGEAKARHEAMAVISALEKRHKDGLAITETEVRQALRNPVVFRENNDTNLIVQGRKGPIVARTEGQKAYARILDAHDLVFALGPAGSGKTFLAVAHGVGQLLSGAVEKLVITRPAVEAGEKLGFLPGDLLEKVDPYLAPIWAALDEILGTEQARKRRERNEIEVAPLAYMRGRTLSRAYIIVDDAQNTTRMQMKMVLTRLGEGSTMVVTGDPSQIDLLSARDCGLNHAISILEGIEGIGVARLSVSDIVRHRLVGEIVQAYDREGAGS